MLQTRSMGTFWNKPLASIAVREIDRP